MVRASDLGVVGHRFAPVCAILKALKMLLDADTCKERVVPGRHKKAGCYPLLVMSQLKLYRAYVEGFKTQGQIKLLYLIFAQTFWAHP